MCDVKSSGYISYFYFALYFTLSPSLLQYSFHVHTSVSHYRQWQGCGRLDTVIKKTIYYSSLNITKVKKVTNYYCYTSIQWHLIIIPCTNIVRQ